MYGWESWLGVRAGKPRRGVSRRAGWVPLYIHLYVRIGVPKKIRAGRIGRTGPFICNIICTYICIYKLYIIYKLLITYYM